MPKNALCIKVYYALKKFSLSMYNNIIVKLWGIWKKYQRTCFALNWPYLAWCKDRRNVYTMHAVQLICTNFVCFICTMFIQRIPTFDIIDKPILEKGTGPGQGRRSRSEPGVFGSFQPEPLEKKNRSRSCFEEKIQEPELEALKN